MNRPLLAFLGFAMSVWQFSAVGAMAVSIAAGSMQFRAAATPGTTYAPLSVKVIDESGAAAVNVTVRFALSSLRGDVFATDGNEKVAVTDSLGIAAWEGLAVSSGQGLFNVSASIVAGSANSVFFVLGRFPSDGCPLPVAPLQTVTTISTDRNPSAVGSGTLVTAEYRVAGSSAGVVVNADVGIIDSNRVIASERLTVASAGRLSIQPALDAGVHQLAAILVADCTYVGSSSQPFFQNVTTGIRPPLDYSDMWWKSTESGWGMSVIQHVSGQLFAVWYHYREDGSPQWLVIPGGVWTSATSFMGTMYRTSGPAYNGVFDSSRVSVLPVGTGTLSFAEASRGTFAWSVEGLNGVKSIERQPF